MAQRRLISARRMRWLQEQIAQWRADGLVDEAAAAAIEARYEASSRAHAARLLLMLGAVLVGVGIVWLVGSNLDIDEAGPATRFGFVAAIWLVLVVLAEVVRTRERFDALAGPLALLAAIAFGATIFQVAQSLQVPAYEPWLVGAWGLGALVYAYANGSSSPLVLGVAATVGWYVWVMGEQADDAGAFVVGLTFAVPLAATAAVVHEHTRLGGFAPAWRAGAALLALTGLFAAALPGVLEEEAAVPDLAWGIGAAAVAFAIGAAVRADREGRLEIAGALLVAAGGLALVLLAPDTSVDVFSDEELPAGQLAHSIAASVLYLAVGIGVAFLGVARNSAWLTNIAFAAIVLFVATQSFGLIAPLFSGAALVLAVGAILLVIGMLADRGRRRLLREVTP